jgi:hypothetical protein
MATARTLEAAAASQGLMSIRERALAGYDSPSERRAAWRLLLNVPRDSYLATVAPSAMHPTSQLARDVGRSMLHLEEDARERPRARLMSVIQCVLDRSDYIWYTQGFHSIAENVLDFSAPGLAVRLLEVLAAGALRPFLQETFDQVHPIIELVRPLMEKRAPRLAKRLVEDDLGFAWTCNWILFYGVPNMSNFELRRRYLDVFVASHPLLIVYYITIVAAANEAVICARENILEYLSGEFPFETEDFRRNFDGAIAFFREFPPSQVIAQGPPNLFSSVCEILIKEESAFPYEFPPFPILDEIPRSLYMSRLDPSKKASVSVRLMSNVLRAVGRQDLAMELQTSERKVSPK